MITGAKEVYSTKMFCRLQYFMAGNETLCYPGFLLPSKLSLPPVHERHNVLLIDTRGRHHERSFMITASRGEHVCISSLNPTDNIVGDAVFIAKFVNTSPREIGY